MSLANEALAKELERLFQNGGPRVYVGRINDNGVELLPFGGSERHAKFLVEVGASVYARKKQRSGRYEWAEWTRKE